jgi:hypothetical protein
MVQTRASPAGTATVKKERRVRFVELRWRLEGVRFDVGFEELTQSAGGVAISITTSDFKE